MNKLKLQLFFLLCSKVGACQHPAWCQQVIEIVKPKIEALEKLQLEEILITKKTEHHFQRKIQELENQISKFNKLLETQKPNSKS